MRPLAALAPGRTGAQAGLGLPRISRRVVDRLIAHGRETGELTVEQERLARNVLRVGGRSVASLARELSDCSTPGTEEHQAPAVRTLAVAAAEGAGKVLERMTAARTRLALLIAPGGDGENGGLRSGDILGYVRLFDLLAPDAQGKAVGALARPVPRLSSKATLRGALTVMQRECADVAVVELALASPSRRKLKGRPAPEAGPEAGPDRPVLGVVRIAQLISELLGAPPPQENGQPALGAKKS